MKQFPFLSLPHTVVLLRLLTAAVFLAHAVVRICGGTIDRFAGFLENEGFFFGKAVVWSITAFELLGGALMAIGYGTRWLAAGFILLLVAGIVLIHASNGWFVGEHGTGGIEYSAVLIAALLVIAAAAKK